MKKTLAILLAVVMAITLFTACGDKPAPTPDSKTGSVYYLNFKPEADKAWQDLAKLYTEKTGVPVTVLTAASGTYDQVLTAEMDKDAAPTMFQVGNAGAVKTWGEYCYDLTNTDIMKEMTTDAFNLKNEAGETVSIGYCYEAFGIIVNKALLKQAGYELTDITNFESLKKVADDIHSRAAELGFDAFTSAGLDGSSSWRFSGHLANMPLFYEFRDNGVTSQPATITGAYLDNYKNLWDLYTTDSATTGAALTTATGDQAEAEFGEGKAVFYQNGTWEYSNLTNEDNGYLVTAEDMSMMPIYIGVDGEENQGLCTGSENYWCVNNQASAEDQQATLDFLEWVITSDEGRDSMANVMGFTTPFDTFADGYTADNVFIQADAAYTKAGKYSVTWNFSTIPSETWKDGVGSALLEYAQGTGDWDGVVTAFVDGWKTEYDATHE